MPTVAQPLRKIFFKAKKKWIADFWKFAKKQNGECWQFGQWLCDHWHIAAITA
jgi:hypothetical protein